MIDDELIARARRALGASGLKDTIDCALQQVVALDAGRRFITRLEKMDGLDLDNPDVMKQAWRD